MYNIMRIIWIIILCLVCWCCCGSIFKFGKEHFNDKVGTLCLSCSDKTVNQCMDCFNCGFCEDQFGNSKCIAGDHKGPYNFEDCAKWYYNDPFSYMIKKNGSW